MEKVITFSSDSIFLFRKKLSLAGVLCISFVLRWSLALSDIIFAQGSVAKYKPLLGGNLVERSDISEAI